MKAASAPTTEKGHEGPNLPAALHNNVAVLLFKWGPEIISGHTTGDDMNAFWRLQIELAKQACAVVAEFKLNVPRGWPLIETSIAILKAQYIREQIPRQWNTALEARAFGRSLRSLLLTASPGQVSADFREAAGLHAQAMMG